MERLPILLVNRDEGFLEDPQHLVERRGCELYTAATVDDVRQALSATQFVLALINACSARMSPASLRGLHAGLRRKLPVPSIVLAPHEEAESIRALALPDMRVLTPPLRHGFLLDLSAGLIGVGTRRSLSAVVQLFFAGDEGNVVQMGFVENVSRHGLLVRVQGGLPVEADEGVASFLLARGGKSNEVRFRIARQAGERGPAHYGLAFTQVTPDVYGRIADFLAKG